MTVHARSTLPRHFTICPWKKRLMEKYNNFRTTRRGMKEEVERKEESVKASLEVAQPSRKVAQNVLGNLCASGQWASFSGNLIESMGAALISRPNCGRRCWSFWLNVADRRVHSNWLHWNVETKSEGNSGGNFAHFSISFSGADSRLTQLAAILGRGILTVMDVVLLAFQRCQIPHFISPTSV